MNKPIRSLRHTASFRWIVKELNFRAAVAIHRTTDLVGIEPTCSPFTIQTGGRLGNQTRSCRNVNAMPSHLALRPYNINE